MRDLGKDAAVKARLSALSVVVALGVFHAPGAAFAQREPIGRWDAREFPREQREQRLRACGDYKKSLRDKPAAVPRTEPIEKPVARPAAPPEQPPCGRLKS